MPQPNQLIEIDGVTKRFGNFAAVENVSLDIGSGEFLALMGSSGCGKTTTLRMLAGLDRPSEGEVRLRGQRVNELKTWERDTPLVWQNLALFPFLNVVENVEFGLRMRGARKAERSRRARAWLERLGIAEFAKRRIGDLSGGQRQRVALARSLVTEPPILLLDEPLSALDANLKVHMQAVLTQLQKDIGITFVYVTHSHSEAFAMADRVAIMSEGRIEQLGSPKALYNRPVNRFVAEFIGGKNIISGRITEASADNQVTVESQHGIFQAPLSNAEPVAAKAGDEIAICVGADRVELTGADNQLCVVPSCTIVSEEFVGSMVTIHFETETGLRLQAQRPYTDWGTSGLQPGQRVGITWPADAALLLQGS